MVVKQRTIQKPATIKGKGLHTGVDVELTFQPAPENHGFKFKRVDLDNQPVISAVAENVVDTSRGTTIEEKGVRVSTIEHVMAALVGMGIDNVLIEINGPETPIADGSSKYFLEALKDAGVVELEADRRYYEIKEKIVYSDPQRGVEIAIFPDDHLSIDVMIDYNSKVLGHQYAMINSMEDFEKEISSCRTFVFLHEVELLLKHNLIKGGDLNNAIVIMDRQVTQDELDRLAELFNKPKIHVKPEGILNNIDIHFSNEPARHKLLDLIGDLALIGTAIKGRIVATRPGHAANTETAKMLRQLIKREMLKGDVPKYDPNQQPLYNINQIKEILPHRPPMLLIDKVMSLDEKTVIGIKNVTMNEPFFVGHFPDEPVMPGVLQIEAMAQLGGVLVLGTVPDPKNYLTYFLKIDKVKFKRKVVPGDTLIFKCDLIGEIRRGIATMWAQAFVGDNVVCEGEMTAQIVKNKA
ncbi:MAG: bifunctional UDP-3-O-[3-hydroxymyristoyl] N-acetylglucosamine deacetylase/3-hydroxyacyl-ACP dehydratase [Bacteroidota bacterium]|nr:bifunctional UDP-3-O-[3-hydroxymyristoyl] N-acetylglucosamine deacetylase/3-hydroxyacyl-ACP dehydratase [Bacteroidota bacterium]